MSVVVLLVSFVAVLAVLVAWLVRASRRDQARRGMVFDEPPPPDHHEGYVSGRMADREYRPPNSIQLTVTSRTIDWVPPPRVETERLWAASSRADPFRIEYADANGEVTERLINLQSVDRIADVIYLRAFCRIRSAERTFRGDRIVRAWDEVSGAEIANPAHYFSRSLPNEDRSDPEHEKVMARVRPGLRALKWICLADQEISSDEMEVLLDFIGNRSAMGRAKAVEWNRARAAAEIDQMRPTLATALAAVAKMPPNGRERAILVASAERLISSNEEGVLRRSRRLLGAHQIAARATGEE